MKLYVPLYGSTHFQRLGNLIDAHVVVYMHTVGHLHARIVEVYRLATTLSALPTGC